MEAILFLIVMSPVGELFQVKLAYYYDAKQCRFARAPLEQAYLQEPFFQELTERGYTADLVCDLVERT